MIFYDTETCGFQGPIVLIQYAVDDEEIKLYYPWEHSANETLKFIEWMINQPMCGFNLAFDHFHLCQMYTTLLLIDNKNIPLKNIINEYAVKEEHGRDGPCLKPINALDLMLHARKGPYQSTMDRSEIRIKRIPEALAETLKNELDQRIQLPDILFAKQSNIKERWKIRDLHDDLGTLLEFKDLVLKFNPSSALKALASDALGIDDPLLMKDIGVTKRAFPKEFGYAPFCTAIGNPANWNGAWPDYGCIRVHLDHWLYIKDAKQYAIDDVDYTRRLFCYFSAISAGKNQEQATSFQNFAHCDFNIFKEHNIPFLSFGDDDSILACMVAAVRWHGFKIDIKKLQNLRNEAQAKINNSKYNFQSVAVCRKYLQQVLTPTEQIILSVNDKITTKGLILEELAKWTIDEVCKNCSGQGCNQCDSGLIKGTKKHPAAERAQDILDARHSKKEIEIYDKLLKAGRFHASFKVIGTLSNRMSGSDNFNPQGIKRDKRVRECFIFCDDLLILCGGDFDGYEISLMDAAYNDPILHDELKNGKKIHALAGVFFFDMTYDEILATRGLPDPNDKYDRSKKGVFALFYGGESYTLKTRVGIPEEKGDEAYKKWCAKYKKWGEARKQIFDQFCSMRQPNGIGTKVEWHEPADYIESLFNFRRYFTLENKICKVLFDLGENPPDDWQQIKVKVIRRDRMQSVSGATRSACFGAAFQIQAANMRAAANHVIQSSGGTITKGLQCKLWSLQPSGISEWKILLFNAHDEIQAPMLKNLIPKAKKIISNYLSEISKRVPLIKLDWKTHMKTWADK